MRKLFVILPEIENPIATNTAIPPNARSRVKSSRVSKTEYPINNVNTRTTKIAFETLWMKV